MARQIKAADSAIADRYLNAAIIDPLAHDAGDIVGQQWRRDDKGGASHEAEDDACNKASHDTPRVFRSASQHIRRCAAVAVSRSRASVSSAAPT